jgi:hypothetical protein
VVAGGPDDITEGKPWLRAGGCRGILGGRVSMLG